MRQNAKGREPRAFVEFGADGSPSLGEFTVAQMILALSRHAETYYQPDEDGNSEAENFRFSLRPLRLMYGDTPTPAKPPR